MFGLAEHLKTAPKYQKDRYDKITSFVFKHFNPSQVIDDQSGKLYVYIQFPTAIYSNEEWGMILEFITLYRPNEAEIATFVDGTLNNTCTFKDGKSRLCWNVDAVPVEWSNENGRYIYRDPFVNASSSAKCKEDK